MFLKYLKSLFIRPSEINTIEEENYTNEICDIPINIKDKLIKEEIEIAHIYVYDKEKIIVKFFRLNGSEDESRRRNGRYSPELIKHYSNEFSTLGYKVKIHNSVTRKSIKQKNLPTEKVLKEVLTPKFLEPYEIGIVQWFDDQLGYGFIKSRLNIIFFVHKTQLNGVKIVQNDVLIFKCKKNEKGNYADKVLLLKNNKKSLVEFIKFNDKYRKINRRFFESQAIRSIKQIFFDSTYLKEISEESFVNIISSCVEDYRVIQIIDHYVEKNKTINSSLENILINSLTNENFTYMLKSNNLNIFLKSPQIVERLNTFPSFIKNKYEKWTNAIREAMDYKHVDIMFDPQRIYKSFTDADYFLARQWMDENVSNKDFEYAKMLSARGAELTALKFYQNLNLNVSDTAVSQINNSSQDWKLFDLLLDNKKSIDVKNSRGLVNEKISYSEYCVPRFKETRQKEQVVILGVLSPYLKLNNDTQALDTETTYGVNEIENSINILGEVTFQTIKQLDIVFSKGKLDVDMNQKSFVPDWLLEYPREFYKEREDAKSIFKSIYIEHPTKDEYKTLDINAIPFFLSCGLDLPSSWIGKLTKDQVDFYNRLKVKCSIMITKPYLYLALLKHFLERLNNSLDLKYSPLEYINILYYEDNYMYPLGIYDPTKIIKKFIDTLETLWTYRYQINLENFSTFKYTSKGMLRGKEQMEVQWSTLLAYCGGFIDGKGSCGYKPLVKGMHSTCHVCRNIICPECNFCSKECKRMNETNTDE